MRSRFSILVATAVTSTALVAMVTSPATAGDWPSFLGPDRNATSAETGIRTTWPLPILWDVALDEGYSAPSVADGRIFVFDRVADRARLRALDARSGDALWESRYATAYEDMYGYSGGPRAAPVIDRGRVFTFGSEGRLRAHAVADGKLLWDVDTERAFGVQQNFFGAGSTPIVEGDLLIAAVGGSPADSPNIKRGDVIPNGTALVAFDLATGKPRWQSGDELASYASPVVTTIRGARRGLYFARGGLLGFDPKDGTIDFHLPWRARLRESVNAATPVVVGDRVFITETYGPGGALIQLGTDGPKILWQDQGRQQAMPCHWNTPVHHGGILYGSAGRSTGDAELRAVEMSTGKILWAEKGLGRSSVLWVDGHLVVLQEGGTLRLVQATPERYISVAEMTPTDGDGKPLLRHPAWNAPVLANGVLYVRGKDRLVALELIPSRAGS